MDRLPVEFLYFLAIVGFLVFNHLVQRATRRRQEEAARQAPAPPEEPPSVEPEHEWSDDNTWGRAPVPASAVMAPAPPEPATRRRLAPAPELRRRVHPVRAMLSDRHELRRAVVLTIVLGPCRAQQAPDR